MSALAGDAVSITAFVVTLPTLLLQTGYSRGFEDEADTYAFERLKTLGIAPRAFADALTALERAHATQSGALTDAGKALPDYLSTHRRRNAGFSGGCPPREGCRVCSLADFL